MTGTEPFVDRLLDRTLVGYTRLGPAVRRRLPGWPDDPPAGALAGKHVAITGASSGLGEACARQAHALGAHVHLVVRDEAKGAEVARSIHPEEQRVTVWRCDLADPASVDAFATAFVATGPPLHGLVHNAGALPAERTESEDGHELTMALHVLAPVRMTEALLPALAGQDARVVLVTSGGMYAQQLPVDDPDLLDEEYSGTKAYARSKRTQVELLGHLQQRWGEHGVAVYATHPGWVETPGVRDSLPRFAKLTGRVLREPEDGTETTTWLLARKPRPEGGLWHDRRRRPTTYLGRNGASEAERDTMWRWVLAATNLDRSTR